MWTIRDLRRLSKKTTLILAGLVVAALFGGGYLISKEASATKTFESRHISFSYNKSYSQQPLVESAGSSSKTVVRRLDAQDPVRTITLTYEKDAKTGATLTKQDFLDFLEANAETSLPRDYSNYDFDKEKTERRQVSGIESSQITFSYTAKDKKTKVYATLLIIPLDKDGYYLKMESVDKSNLEKESKSLIDSLKISR